MKRNRDPRMYICDIVESCDLIIGNIKSQNIEEFRKDITMQDAIIRRFEIIGGAVKRLPPSVINMYPDVAWKDAAGFRDVLIHDYPEIVVDEVYLV